MKYTTLPVQKSSRDMLSVFRGYNHNLQIAEGEFYDMKNMTSDHFPLLSSRGKRGVYTSAGNVGGIIAKEKLCYVSGEAFVIGDTRVDMGLSAGTKQLVSMGAYVIILPDKKYINTQDTEDRGDIESAFDTVDKVSFDVSTADGKAYTHIVISSTKPESTPPETEDELPANERTVWINTANINNVTLNMYSRSTASWVPVTPYTRISSTGIGVNFEKHDSITISGIVEDVIIGSVEALNGTWVLRDKGDDYLVVDAFVWRGVTLKPEDATVHVAREMPNIDFLIESENRLWGCRYGIAKNGDFVNEIYASALGDFKNWSRFMGTAADSYAVSCGTDGPFTGAIPLDGYPLFWKENYLHKIYGNYPANYQVQTTECRGVQAGCANSLVIVNEVLYYKSRSAVCAYDGSLPVEVSAALGTERYSFAAAGCIGNKYCISMEDEKGEWHLFVFDTARGLWHREDNFRADGFCQLQGELYAIDHGSKKIVTMLGSGMQDKNPVDWMVQTGVLGLGMPDNKYISRINIRMSLDLGSRVRFLIQYDSSGKWEHLFSMSGTSLQSYTVPVRPRRCDHFCLRMEGIGQVRVYSISKTIEQGSDAR